MELLLVVSIVLILAAIVIPDYLSAKGQAREASAVASMRAIGEAQVTYASEYPAQGFADDVAKLGNEGGGLGFIDWPGGCSTQPCLRSGYAFSIADPSGTPVSSYLVFAVPVNSSGSSAWYCMGSDAVIFSQYQQSMCPAYGNGAGSSVKLTGAN